MTISDRLRYDELDKINQELRAEILECKRLKHELIELKDKLEVEVRDTGILHKLSTRYIEGDNSFSLFQEMVEAAIAITRADKGNIQILDLSTGKLKIAAQRGFHPPFLKFFELVDAGEAATCGIVMKKMERVVIHDITCSPIFSGSKALGILLDEGVRAVQSTPLVNRSGKLLGIISTHYSKVHVPDEHELRLIDILARQAADIVERQKVEEELRQSEQRTKLKLENILSPNREMVNPKLAEIIDTQAIQSLMDDFYKLAHIPIGIIDIKGNVLVGVGWQDICTKFHRNYPETCKHCMESDTKLSSGVLPGEFKAYKCKNNMWDIATPIIVGGKHVGNIFLGQFFFEGEPLDYELFRSQARKYGFNEDEYIAALEKVPRLSKETVNGIMVFFMKFASIISQLGYSNLKLAQSLAEREALVGALRESEERFRWVIENSLDAAYRRNLLTDRYDYMSPVIKQLTGYSAREISSVSTNEILDFVHPDDRPLVAAKLAQAFDLGFGTLEYRFRCKDGQYRWFADHFTVTTDQNRKPIFSGGIVRDITERKRAEKTLAFERSQLLSIFDGIDDVVYVTDPYTYEVLYANRAMKEKFGGELVGGICYREFQWRDSPCDFCSNPIILKEKGKPYHWEYYNPTVGRHFMIMDRIIKWPDGRDVRFEIATDITERKRTEEALKRAHCRLEVKVKERTAELEKAYKSLEESEKGLAEAQNMANIGSWYCNFITGEVNWSDELYRIFEYDPKKLALSYNEYLDYVHPDDRDYVNNAYMGAINGNPLDIDHRIVLANGEVRTIHVQSEVLFDGENIPIRAKGIVQDITERKKTEEKIKILANAVESSNDAIITTSLEGVVTSWNKGAEQVYGYSAEEILGKNVSVIEAPNLKGEIGQLIEKIKNNEKVQYYETLRLKKDGTPVNVSVSLSPIFNSSGELIAVSAISRDITERKKAEETLAKIEDARKKEIHHRIKNNLQVISSLLDLQAEKFLDKEVLEAFKESQDRVFSMSLIHEELYKGEGTDSLDFSAYLQKLAENLFQTYSLRSKNLCLSMELEEDAFFDMDTAVPLGIIVNELISNSLKHAFTEGEKGKIRIRLCREEKNDEVQESVFSLTISDNGKGIPENMEFERLDSLGLQLVNTLVDQLDGKIEIKREQGTEFRITFGLTEKSDVL